MQTTDSVPLVSCVMLTIPGREQMAEQAKRCFYSQTYPRRELVVVGGPQSIGRKRNIGAKVAAGEIICHWDDDDLSAPGRLAEQVTRLITNDVDVVGYSAALFADFESREVWRYDAQSHQYAIGSSLMYWRSYWQSRQFADTSICEDNDFVFGDITRPRARVHAVSGDGYLLARIHPGNVQAERKEIARINRTSWQPVDWSRAETFREGLRCV